MTHPNTQAYLDSIKAQIHTDEPAPTYANPFDDNDWDGNDDQLDALKSALGEALEMLRDMRETYGPLHDEISDLIESGRNLTHESEASLAEMLTACVVVDQKAADLLTQYPEDNA